ncbi:MAG: hypothetical protein JSR62_15500 [Nitrospira sp.]|nr:hypothetical protein [Nitrospira sp.]
MKNIQAAYQGRRCLVLMLLLSILVTHASAQWGQIPSTENSAYTVVVNDGHYLYTGTYIGGLRRTSDSGRTWEAVNNGLPDSSIFVTMYAEPSLLLLGTGKGAYRSTDNGETWRVIADSVTRGKTVHQFCRHGRFVFMAADSGLARSANDGIDWTQLKVPILGPQGYICLAGGGDYLLTGMQGDGVYRSLDSGVTWTLSSVQKGGELIYSLCNGEGFSLAAGGTGATLYRSSDKGITWSDIDTSLHRLTSLIVSLKVLGNRSVLGATEVGVILSTDKGDSWKRINEGLPFNGHVSVVSIDVTEDEVLIATYVAGCFRRPLSELITPPSGVEDATAGAAATRLGQSIPNPTSGEVLIPYSLAASGHVTIALYNSLLQQVAIVVDAEEPSGPHTARLEASALPPGAYYYRLHAGTVNLTRQMVIVR